MEYGGERLALVFSAEEVRERVAELGREIAERYRGKPLLVVCVLKGAFIFCADLLRRLPITPRVDFVRLASYGDRQNPEMVVCRKELETDVKGWHVLIVEDIVDTGRSLTYLVNDLRSKGPESIAICALVDKKERREVDLTVDFAGFDLKKGFIVGYGLDYAERFRELDGIYEVVQDNGTGK